MAWAHVPCAHEGAYALGPCCLCHCTHCARDVPTHSARDLPMPCPHCAHDVPMRCPLRAYALCARLAHIVPMGAHTTHYAHAIMHTLCLSYARALHTLCPCLMPRPCTHAGLYALCPCLAHHA